MEPQHLVEYVVMSLVSNPDEVNIRSIAGQQETIIEIRVADDDVGKVIGKHGSVARALRTLVSAVGAREDANFALEIVD